MCVFTCAACLRRSGALWGKYAGLVFLRVCVRCVCVCVGGGKERTTWRRCVLFDFCRLIFWPNHEHKLDWIVAFINFTYKRKVQNFWVSFKCVLLTYGPKHWAWNCGHLNERHLGHIGHITFNIFSIWRQGLITTWRHVFAISANIWTLTHCCQIAMASNVCWVYNDPVALAGWLMLVSAS